MKPLRLFLQARADDAGVLRLLRRFQAFALAHVAADQVDAHVVEFVAALLLTCASARRGVSRLRRVPFLFAASARCSRSFFAHACAVSTSGSLSSG